MEKTVLFLYTKKYPFGTNETYVHNEADVLSRSFSRVIVIPTELFENEMSLPKRSLPANFEVETINNNRAGLKNGKVRFNTAKVLLQELMHEKNKVRFVKEFRRYRGILSYQKLLASKMTPLLEKYKDYKATHYSYWLHNSAILLGILKDSGYVNNFISRAHSIDLYHNDWPLAFETDKKKVLPFQYYKISRADAIFSISGKGTEYLVGKFPELKANFHTQRLGVNDNGVNLLTENSIFTIVSCSAINANKRVLDIARTIALINQPVRWLHFGSGALVDDLNKLVAKMPGHIQVELKGQVANAEVIDYYKRNPVNLFINLSKVEGIPVSIMEAISFGVPCVATNVFGNAEIVTGKTGFLVPEDFSPQDVAFKIEEFISNLALQNEFRINARKFYLDNFNLASNLQRFLNEIRKYRN